MLGIDVSKDTLHCTLLDPATRRTIWCRSYDNSATGISRLLKATPTDCSWALEPTGNYSTAGVKRARSANREVLLAEPRKCKRFLQSIQNRAKCDRLDSGGIGLYALCHTLPPYPLKSPLMEQLDQLLKARKGLALAAQQLQAQSQAMPHAREALRPAIEALKDQQKQVDAQIKCLAKIAESQPEPKAVASKPDASAKPEASAKLDASAGESPPKQHSKPTVVTASAAMACIEKLQKVPGIGPVTATTVATRMADRCFPRSDSFVAYCGLDIATKQSGKRSGNHGLTKQGDAELRRLLYLAAQASLRSKDTTFRAQYEREQLKGLSKTAATCAVARKMARLCWALVNHGGDYDPQRVYQTNP